MIFLGEKGRGRHSWPGEEHKQAGTETCAPTGSRALHVASDAASPAGCPVSEWWAMGLGVCV